MPELVPYLPLIAGVAVALIAGAFAVYQRVRGEKRQLPPTWPEMWARMDALELRVAARDKAFANILQAAADQWPKEIPGPVFDDADIEILEDTIPSQWLRRRPPHARTT